MFLLMNDLNEVRSAKAVNTPLRKKTGRARISTMIYYYNNLEKERERKRLYAQSKRAI